VDTILAAHNPSIKTGSPDGYHRPLLGRPLPTADVGYPAAQLVGRLSGGEIAYPASRWLSLSGDQRCDANAGSAA
jgi:hypothetical protein